MAIRVSMTGRGRIRVVGEDGQEYFVEEYATKTEKIYSATVNLTKAPNQAYTVTLELASHGEAVLMATNQAFEVTWGDLGLRLGELYLLPYNLTQEVRSLRLTWAGQGVAFQVSTDNGKTWESVTNGQATNLRNPGSNLLVRGLLTIDDTTVLDGYHLEVNPAKYSLFTGKTLEESTGLVYFGGRWYDPEFGRFITVDPAEDGENWYGYCGGNPINYVDPDGQLSVRGWGVLWGGMKSGFKTYAPQVAIGVAQALLISSAITVGMSALMPVFPAAIPVIAAAMPYISAYFMAQFAVSMIDDFRFLIKNFVPVFFGKSPPDATVRQYGIRISKVGLTIAAMVATQAGMRAILKTGILQRIGINIGKGIKTAWKDEGGYVKLGSNNSNNEVEAPSDKPITPPRNRSQLRQNILKNGLAPSPKSQAHHRLPWKFKDLFAERGLNVNDSRFGQWVDSSHQSWSRAYENEWSGFFARNPNATQGEILNFLNMLGEWPR